MYTHSSRITVSSKACPGVVFTLRQISYGRRAEIVRRLEAGGAVARPDDAGMTESLRWVQALMGAMLVDVTGLELDGQSFVARFRGDERDTSIQEFLDRAPEGLVEEIFTTLLEELRLGGDAEKNSAPPSGSSPAETEGGSSASSASAPSCGSSATAAATTPGQS